MSSFGDGPSDPARVDVVDHPPTNGHGAMEHGDAEDDANHKDEAAAAAADGEREELLREMQDELSDLKADQVYYNFVQGALRGEDWRGEADANGASANGALTEAERADKAGRALMEDEEDDAEFTPDVAQAKKMKKKRRSGDGGAGAEAGEEEEEDSAGSSSDLDELAEEDASTEGDDEGEDDGLPLQDAEGRPLVVGVPDDMAARANRSFPFLWRTDFQLRSATAEAGYKSDEDADYDPKADEQGAAAAADGMMDGSHSEGEGEGQEEKDGQGQQGAEEALEVVMTELEEDMKQLELEQHESPAPAQEEVAEGAVEQSNAPLLANTEHELRTVCDENYRSEDDADYVPDEEEEGMDEDASGSDSHGEGDGQEEQGDEVNMEE